MPLNLGYVSCLTTGVNVRQTADVNAKILHVIKTPTICKWILNANSVDWLEIWVYTEDNQVIHGWINKKFLKFTTITQLPDDNQKEGVTFINVPFPEINVTPQERKTLSEILIWMSTAIEQARIID